MRLVLPLLLTLVMPASHGSYAFYVGSDLTDDGSVLLGGTGEEPSSHWLEIVPRRTHAADATITVGATADAELPARLTTIPQVRTTLRHLTMNYSSFAGFPAPLTNGGLNEAQVAIRDVWAPSRDELVAATPPDQTGPQYSDLARIALERAHTAREAIEIMGALIDRHGFTTYGGNTHLVADPTEGWVMMQFAGGEGLWVAERLGADEVRVLYPGYVNPVPLDYATDPDWMGSANLVDVAAARGWFDPSLGAPLDVMAVYGLYADGRRPGIKRVDPADMEAALRERVPVDVADMMALVRDARIADDDAGYGQVAHLRAGLADADLALLWVAPTSSVTAPFLPWWIGTTAVPPEYGPHRYLTQDAGATFLDPAFQLHEATEFAGRLFTRLMYYACDAPAQRLPRVTGALSAFEARMRAEVDDIERIATLALAEERGLGRGVLTRYSHARAAEAMTIGRGLVAGLDAEVRAAGGFPPLPAGGVNDGDATVNCLVDGDPDVPLR
ncbi:MAG TPA: C69 family dipeptidase [Pseudomonadales bacterium]|nr:C69 family dipeptidase [Pseudomonadales bacterium]